MAENVLLEDTKYSEQPPTIPGWYYVKVRKSGKAMLAYFHGSWRVGMSLYGAEDVANYLLFGPRVPLPDTLVGDDSLPGLSLEESRRVAWLFSRLWPVAGQSRYVVRCQACRQLYGQQSCAAGATKPAVGLCACVITGASPGYDVVAERRP